MQDKWLHSKKKLQLIQYSIGFLMETFKFAS